MTPPSRGQQQRRRTLADSAQCLSILTPAIPTLLSDPRLAKQRTHAQLPLHLGGIGIGGTHNHRCGAYVASFCAAVTIANSHNIRTAPNSAIGSVLLHLQHAFASQPPNAQPGLPLDQQPPPKPGVQDHVLDMLGHIEQNRPVVQRFGMHYSIDDVKSLPSSDWNIFSLPSPKHLQHIINSQIDKITWATQIRKDASPSSAARIVSQNQRGAFSALAAIPSQQGLRISDPALILYVRTTLEDPKLEQELAIIAQNCGCGARADNTQHSLNCIHNGAAHFRHNSCTMALNEAIITYAGCATRFDSKLDARDWDDLQNIRPDLLVSGFALDGGDTAIEFATVNPSQSSLAPHAALVPLYAARLRQQAKLAKYRDAMAASGTELLAATMEVTGAFGPQLNDIIARISSRFLSSGKDLDESVTWAAPSVGTLISQLLSVAMIRGNHTALMRLAGNRNRLAG